MNALLTGYSGFLGHYIKEELLNQDINVTTIGRHHSNDIICDISEGAPKLEHYDLVVHAAGKAHLNPNSNEEKKAFYDVNLNGLENILNALSSTPKYLVFISTVAVYGRENGENIDEDYELNAKDPYGESKILAERLLLKWKSNNNCKVTILRLPLIFGLNPPGNLDKMISAIREGIFFNIAKGNAKKSVVLAKDVAEFIPKIAPTGGIYNLTAGYAPTFRELTKIIDKKYNKRTISIPYFLGKSLALVGDILQKITKKNLPFSSKQFQKMTKPLTFSDAKARARGWTSRNVLEFPEKWL